MAPPGVVVVSVSACSDVSNHPLIDALEVYTRPHGAKAVPASTLANTSTPAPAAHDRVSKAAVPAVNAITACSRLLGHTLGLAATTTKSVVPMASAEESTAMNVDVDPSEELSAGKRAVEGPLLDTLSQSALSVLRKTCLAAEPARWGDLRSASRHLLATAQPDSSRRSSRIDNAYVAEARRALLNVGEFGTGGVGNHASSGGVSSFASRAVVMGERIKGPMPPVLLRRVAQLCRKVCSRRSELLRSELAPALAAASAAAGIGTGDAGGGESGGSGDQLQRVQFVFPALVRKFWDSCVSRRSADESMEVVLSGVLRLAVHEMRAAGTAAARTAATVATAEAMTSVATSAEDNNNDGATAEDKAQILPAEEHLLRSGLGELMPLLQSNIARVAQATSSHLVTLLLGPRPGVNPSYGGILSSPSTTIATHQSEWKRGTGTFAECMGGASASVGENDTRQNTMDVIDDTATSAEATVVGVAGAGATTAAGVYAGSAESASEAEGRVETEATSDPGSDSDADADGEANPSKAGDRDDGRSAGSSALAALRALAAAGQGEAGGEINEGEDPGGRGTNHMGTDDPGTNASGDQAALDRAFDLVAAVSVTASSASSFGNLLPQGAPRKRAKPTSGKQFGRGDGNPGGTDSGKVAMDITKGNTGKDSSSVVSVGVTGVGSVVAPTSALEEAASAAGGTRSGSAASKICYRCDGCDDFPLQYVRHHCLICADFDLCPRCYELFHGPNNQFQGGNSVMLGGHSTAHGMVALQVRHLVLVCFYVCSWCRGQLSVGQRQGEH